MKRRADRGTVRLRLLAASTCVARVAWYAEGRLVGHRRVWHEETDLFLPAGRWTLEVTDERSVADPTRLAATRVEVVVRAGWRTTTEVVLDRGAVLRGRVVTAEEQRARFATVTATAADGRVFTVRADGLGTLSLSGLPSTTYLVRATKGAWQSAPVLVEPQVGVPTEVALALAEPATPASRSGAAELVVGAAFTGTVVDPSTGAPAYAALVELRDARGTLLARSRADHSGRFVVGGDLPASSGLSLVVKSGPDRAVVDRRVLRGLACTEAALVDLGTVVLPHGARPPRPARHDLPRGGAVAMALPATRV
ncbi:unannotated protein [freshwater metagenome]|uniref:Unannotated protein n=1 Tax=freshwater metagenome TaxID=449393 RepID=A0A6J6VIJ7_9ZZZZ|nr:hypothetical protein [Actinomycetota bacterium]